MKRPARPVFLLHHDPLFVERVRTATRSGFSLHEVTSWTELTERIRSAPASALVIVDPLEPRDRSEVSTELLGLLNLYPSMTVIPALEAGPGSFDTVRRLGAAGAVQVICTDEDIAPVSIRRRIEAARGRPLRHLIASSLHPSTSSAARAILNAAVDVVVDGEAGEQLARDLFVTTRTLLRWCRKAGLPAPRRLLLWIRLLLAAELLDDPGRSVSDVALACGYSSDGGLRNAFRSTIDESPGSIRGRAFDIVAAGFLQALNESRTRPVRYRKKTAGE